MQVVASCRGISILEVLLTTTAAGVVGAVLYPAFITTTSHCGKTSTCISNLKQAGLAAFMYMGDHDDYFPRASNWADASLELAKNKSKTTFACFAPSLDPTRTAHPETYGHAFRRSLEASPSIDIANPADEIMLFDSTDLSWNASGGLNLLPYPGRSKAKVNSGFYSDGHASTLNLERLARKYLSPNSGQ
jgi:hypothetical protein